MKVIGKPRKLTIAISESGVLNETASAVKRKLKPMSKMEMEEIQVRTT